MNGLFQGQNNRIDIQKKDLQVNISASLLDAVFYGAALGMASYTTIIPLFISTITTSSILIGLAGSLRTLFWQFPQLFIASRVQNAVQFKRLTSLFFIIERIPIAALGIFAFFVPRFDSRVALSIIFLLLIWNSLGAGLSANPWQNLMYSIFPPTNLSTFLGLIMAIQNVVSAGGAIFAGVILAQGYYPSNYGCLFLLVFVALSMSFVFYSWTRETPRQRVPVSSQSGSLFTSVRTILSGNRNFLLLLLGRTFCQFGLTGSYFYTVYMLNNLNSSLVMIGLTTSVFMISTAVANLVLGRLADRWSHIGVLSLGAVAISIGNILAGFVVSPEWFYLVQILSGIALVTNVTIIMATTLQLGTDTERPYYIGILATFVAPATLLAPILGGWIADALGYRVMFIASALMGALGLIFFAAMRTIKPENGAALATRKHVE